MIPNQPTLDNKIYQIKAKNLSIKEFNRSNIPESNLYSVAITFEYNRQRYTAVHVCNYKPKTPYVMLRSKSKDIDNFYHAEEIIQKSIKGKVFGRTLRNIDDYTKDLFEVIKFQERPKYADIAAIIKEYENSFRNVKILTAFYYDLNEHICRKSNISSRKSVEKECEKKPYKSPAHTREWKKYKKNYKERKD